MTTTTDKKLVFVPNKGLHDYTQAWEFGDLVFCSDGELNRRDFLTMQHALEDQLQDAQEDDYILITSLTSLCCIACGIFASRFGRLNLLVFEKGKYLERLLVFDKEGNK